MPRARREPDVSPIHADLREPATGAVQRRHDGPAARRLAVHARTLARRRQRGGAIFPGGIHAFNAFPDHTRARVERAADRVLQPPARLTRRQCRSWPSITFASHSSAAAASPICRASPRSSARDADRRLRHRPGAGAAAGGEWSVPKVYPTSSARARRPRRRRGGHPDAAPPARRARDRGARRGKHVSLQKPPTRTPAELDAIAAAAARSGRTVRVFENFTHYRRTGARRR